MAARRCPQCGSRVKRILWGMPDRDPGPDVILGGCCLPVEPQPWGCPDCGWRGQLPAHAGGSARPH